MNATLAARWGASESLLLLLAGAALSASLAPAIRSLVVHYNIGDPARERRIHQSCTSRLGGGAIVIAFWVPVCLLGPGLLGPLEMSALDWGTLFGALLIAALGFYDDRHGSGVVPKLGVQIVAATLVWSAGFRIEVLSLGGGNEIFLNGFSFVVTFVWVIGITNALNLADGLDGLACGVAIIALIPATFAASTLEHMSVLGMLLTLLGALGGFLLFNFHPARIFMGDTGSMFVGFLLAVLLPQSFSPHSSVVLSPVVVLCLFYPIADTLFAVTRRIAARASVFVGDRQHVHHRLIDAGLGHKRSVLTLYAISSVFALVGMALFAY